MPFAQATRFFPALTPLLKNWGMSFQSIHFLLFLPVAAGAYFALPQRTRKLWLLLVSYYFYFFMAGEYLLFLLAGTLFTYAAGRIIASLPKAPAKRTALLLSIGGLVLGLVFFKYNRFFAPLLEPAFARLGLAYSSKLFSTARALGISFYTFTAIGYLIDTSRGDVPAEKNLLDFALFLGFFPSVLSGPISRAGGLLPQLKNTARRFNPPEAATGIVLMALGFFKKMAVADTIAIFTAAVFSNLAGYQGLTIALATGAYALQLYFDFSGYTDIARGTAKILGIRLPQNFQNPYFSTNFSGFWARWHMSLSTWLQDYIFTPLVWSRWPERLPLLGKHIKKPPVLSSIAIVFMVSGLWHGDTLCFAVWGGLQAAYRIGEELLHRFLGKPKKNPPLARRIGKTAVVLLLWAQSLLFFAVGSMEENNSVGHAFQGFVRQFCSFSPLQAGRDIWHAVLNGWYNDTRLAALLILFGFVCLGTALWADWYQFARLKSRSLAAHILTLQPAPRRLLYLGLTLCCFAGFIAQSGYFGGGSFIYGGY